MYWVRTIICRNAAALLWAAALTFAWGCGCEEGVIDWDGMTGDASDVEFPDGAETADQPDDAPPGEPDLVEFVDDRVCDEQDFRVHHELVRVMLLLDQSSSMQGSKWAQATDALTELLQNDAFYDMHFGLDAFPDGFPGFWTDCGTLCLRCREDECGTLAPPQVALGPQYVTAPSIIAHMEDPQYPQFCTFTPLVNQMAYYDTGPGPAGAPELYMDDGANYIIVISDGEDEGCYDGSPASALGEHTRSILETHNIRSFAIGFGSTSGEMAAELNAIASNGGTDFTTFIPAEDGVALAAALESIASTIITCTYVLDDVSPAADPDKVNFYLDGVVVPMDEGCTEDTGSGWHWVDDAHTSVEFCGDRCTAIKEGEVGSISATWGCPTIII